MPADIGNGKGTLALWRARAGNGGQLVDRKLVDEYHVPLLLDEQHHEREVECFEEGLDEQLPWVRVGVHVLVQDLDGGHQADHVRHRHDD